MYDCRLVGCLDPILYLSDLFFDADSVLTSNPAWFLVNIKQKELIEAFQKYIRIRAKPTHLSLPTTRVSIHLNALLRHNNHPLPQATLLGMTTKPCTYTDYTVGWVCALPKELIAAAAMLDEPHPDLPRKANDHNSYTLGSVGAHNVAVAEWSSGVWERRSRRGLFNGRGH
ncbi:hypothetical protein BO71DRAFT_445398 [Aspergillus ellipticus CBS 707.79]|uniref:Uncharacterized protein n=1 Tax=Aspergillus ellipticus CBS 707.79 TaxID=1448320 RepID=A0A319CUV8_9EURO|nr:hypothetical protein BO71DRAFT_445398 [Aspergillus ellipticus CBS 707.79]